MTRYPFSFVSVPPRTSDKPRENGRTMVIDWGLDPVPWDRIAGVVLGGSRLQSFACLEIKDPDGLLAGLSPEQRRKAESNRLVRPPRLLVPNGALDAPLTEVVAAIRAGLDEWA